MSRPSSTLIIINFSWNNRQQSATSYCACVLHQSLSSFLWSEDSCKSILMKVIIQITHRKSHKQGWGRLKRSTRTIAEPERGQQLPECPRTTQNTPRCQDQEWERENPATYDEMHQVCHTKFSYLYNSFNSCSSSGLGVDSKRTSISWNKSWNHFSCFHFRNRDKTPLMRGRW